MEGRLALPFHFAAEFLVLVVALGAAVDALRARRAGAGPWAWSQAVGFLALAAAQAAHGSLAAEPDADRVVVVLRASAFLLLAFSVRPAAAVAAPLALFFPGTHASWAVAPAVAALAVAARGARAHRRDQDPATFAFSAAFVAFAIAEGITAAKLSGTMLGAAHAARALGAVFLARWLWGSIARSVRARFVASFVIVLLVGVLVVSAVLNVLIGDTLREDQEQRLAELGGARAGSVYDLAESAAGSAQFSSDDSILIGSLRKPYSPSSDPAAQQELGRIAGVFHLDFMVLVDPARRVRGSIETTPSVYRVRGRLGGSREIAMAGTQVVGEALRGLFAQSVEDIVYAERGARRSQVVALGADVIRDRGRVVGAVVVGYRIDGTFLRAVKQDTGGAEATLLIGSTVASTTYEKAGVLTSPLRNFEGRLRVARETGVGFAALLDVGGEPNVTAFAPIAITRGSPQVVGLLMLSLRTTALTVSQRDFTRTLFLITGIAVALAALLAWLSGGRVTRPIRSLTAAARELRGGNLEARTRVGTQDEVGTLGTAFNEMAEELQRKTGDLSSAAVTEASLRTRIEAILQSMGDGLIATDAQGHVVTFNRAAERLIGRKADRVLGRRVGEVLRGTAAGGRALADAAMHAQATSGTLEGSDGVNRSVALTAAPLIGTRGETAGRVVVVRDVTPQQQAERMKSEFLANISHELRTPITPIRGFAEIMRRKRFPREKMLNFLEGIVQSTERLERIVDILVDFAAIEAGRLKPRAEPVPVRQLLDGATAKWRERDRAHTFVRRGGDQVPPVLGDPRLLGRSIDELIGNAVKFSPGGGRIEITAEPGANGTRARRVRITVRDHGIGIEPEQMPRLFQDFRQLDGSETREYGGLGLGLAYVKRIATAHGGDVEVSSTPGKGSAFSLVLPVAESRTSGRVRSGRKSSR